jgi:hypothetical protein
MIVFLLYFISIQIITSGDDRSLINASKKSFFTNGQLKDSGINSKSILLPFSYTFYSYLALLFINRISLIMHFLN